MATRWNSLVPIKVNVMIWRVERDRLPTRLNLRDKGIDLDSLLCPICGLVGESTEHLFAACTQLVEIWSKIARWWSESTPLDFTLAGCLNWADSVVMINDNKKRFGAVVFISIWVIWNFRSKVFFEKEKHRKDELLDDIRSFSYF